VNLVLPAPEKRAWQKTQRRLDGCDSKPLTPTEFALLNLASIQLPVLAHPKLRTMEWPLNRVEHGG